MLGRRRASRARDPTRRLGGVLAAYWAVLDGSWVGLAPCTKRRMMELILGQQEPLGHIASYPSKEEPAHIVPRTWSLDRDSLHRPFPTYRPPPRALCAVIGAALETIVASLVAFGPA